MPESVHDGKPWTAAKLTELVKTGKISSSPLFLDVGVGLGTYSNLFKATFEGTWTGVEVWRPYINRFNLESKYDTILIEDARKLDWKENYDVCFFGDVMEHMNKDEAMQLHQKALTRCRYVFVSIPIVHMPQDEWEGNPYEKHIKDDWLH